MPLAPFRDTFPTLGERVFVHDSAQLIGDVTLGDDVSIWPGVVLRGDIHRIVVGRGSNVQDLTAGHVTHRHPARPDGSPLVIGEFVTVGHGAILHGCRIGDYCLVGMGAIVLDDAVLEPEVMLGAGSLVSPGKVLESGYLYFGSPARRVRPLTGDERAFLRYSAEHYIKTKDEYLSPQSPPVR